ncbi:MAG: ATP-binding protein [Thermoplasmata archaeon]
MSYPGGKYEEMGRTFLDLVSPHCMLVLGKRGTGKSYTLGVLAEGFASLEDDSRERLSVVIIDTMSVFHSLKKENVNQREVERMKDFGISPKGFGEFVHVMVPAAAIRKAKETGWKLHYDGVLEIPLRSVNVHDWLEIFDLKLTEPAGTLLCSVMSELDKKSSFSFVDIYDTLDSLGGEHAESLKNLFGMMEDLELFSEHGTISDLIEPGRMAVLDVSYLGRLGGYDLRTLVVSILAREQMALRTLYTTMEMQAQAGLIDTKTSKDITKEHPLVYMIIDEAHLFLPKGKNTLATEPLIDWIKLGRHPGLSLILATQEPSALHDSAIRQSDMIIAHNLTARDDVAALGMAKQSYMKKGLDEMVSNMEFRRGLAMVFDDKTRRLQMCIIRPRHSLHTGVDASALPPEDR